MTPQDVDRLTREVAEGNADAFVPLADELQERGHPHGEELVELAACIGFADDPAAAFAAAASFMMLVNDTNGKLPRRDCYG